MLNSRTFKAVIAAAALCSLNLPVFAQGTSTLRTPLIPGGNSIATVCVPT